MYKKIINPKTGRKVSIYGKIGKKILNNYIKLIGGAAVVNDNGQAMVGISEKRIHQEMLSLEELGDWDSTSPGYLREIAIYNLKRPPRDKNITLPTRVHLDRNVFSRKDFKNAVEFEDEDGKQYAIFPGDIEYAEALRTNIDIGLSGIRPVDIEDVENYRVM